MGTLTCLQLANSRIYRENFPPTRNFANIMILPDAFMNPQIELDPSLHWPHPVDVFWLLKCVILPEMAKKYRKIEGRFTVLPVVQSNKIKRICKFASRFCRFNLDLEGILRIFQE